jgi:hypothetical protein
VKKKPVLVQTVPVEGKPWEFVVDANEFWTLIDPDGNHVPPPGIMPMDDITKLRTKAAKVLKGT